MRTKCYCLIVPVCSKHIPAYSCLLPSPYTSPSPVQCRTRYSTQYAGKTEDRRLLLTECKRFTSNVNKICNAITIASKMACQKSVIQKYFSINSSGPRMQRYQIRRVPLRESEEGGPVEGVEAEEDDGEGHPGHPLYVAVPHTAQGRGGGQREGCSAIKTLCKIININRMNLVLVLVGSRSSLLWACRLSISAVISSTFCLNSSNLR